MTFRMRTDLVPLGLKAVQQGFVPTGPHAEKKKSGHSIVTTEEIEKGGRQFAAGTIIIGEAKQPVAPTP